MRPLLTTLPHFILGSLAIAALAASAVPGAAQAPSQPPAKAKKPAAKASKPATAVAPKAATATPAPAAEPMASLRPLAEEAEHVARYDAAIAGARDHPVPAEAMTALREAMAAAAGGKVTEARALRDKVTDPAARKLVDWYLFRGGYGSAGEVRAFLDANPDWPDRNLLTQRSEEALFNSQASARDVKAFFGNGQPRTAVGYAALATAYRADKDEARAKALAQKAWIDLDIPASQEPGFLARVGNLLSEADHKRRLDRLLLNDSRWTGERTERAAVIRRVIALLSEEEKKKAQARLAVFLRAKNSKPAALQAAGPQPGRRLGPGRAARPGSAPAEEGAGGLEDPAGGAGGHRVHAGEAGRLVGGAAGQCLRRTQGRQAEDRLRSRPQSRRALRQRGQGRSLYRRLAGVAPPQRRQAGARTFPGAGRGGRWTAEPGQGLLLARPHLRGAARAGQGAGAVQDRFSLHRHLPRPARAAEARRQGQRAQGEPAGRSHGGGDGPLQRLRCGARPP